MGQTTINRHELDPARYQHGADDHIFVELDEAMSFEANFKAQAITKEVKARDIDGLIEVAPANASYLIHFDPGVIHPDDLIEELREIEAGIDLSEYTWDAKIVDIPVLYEDPWTHETQMEFRDRHQDPDSTDLEYSARINGYDSVEAFIDAHSGAPYMVSMVGFVPGLPWMFQMVPYDEQIEVPKYRQPRTKTPGRAIGTGGAFSVVYPVFGAGGYQLYGRTPVEVLDIDQELADFEESIVLPEPGDILKFRQIDRSEYDTIREAVEDGTYEYTKGEFEFQPEEFFTDPDGYNQNLMEMLYQ